MLAKISINIRILTTWFKKNLPAILKLLGAGATVYSSFLALSVETLGVEKQATFGGIALILVAVALGAFQKIEPSDMSDKLMAMLYVFTSPKNKTKLIKNLAEIWFDYDIDNDGHIGPEVYARKDEEAKELPVNKVRKPY